MILAALLALAAALLLTLVLRAHARRAALLGAFLGAGLLLVPSAATDGLFHDDALARLLAGLVLLVTACVILASNEHRPVYYASILLAAMGMVLAGSAADLIPLFLAIELVTTPTFLLVAWGKSRARLEAMTKYFLVAIVASALLLLGVVLLAASAGSTHIADLRLTGTTSLLGLAAIIAGLGFKLGVWPFGFWIPDVYEGAPSPVAGLLAGATKKAAFAAFLRIAVVLSLGFARWHAIIAALAVLTMTVPNLIALVQTSARRMLAYSIVTHAGYLIMGFVILTPMTASGVLFHMVTHAFMALGAFLVLGVFAQHRLERIDELNGLGWRNPFLGISLTIFLFSLVGILFLSGFASKFYLFYSVALSGYAWLAIVAIANSVLSLYYYFRIIRALYGYPAAGRPFEVHYGTLVAIIICLFVTIFIGLYPVPIIDLAVHAAQGLF